MFRRCWLTAFIMIAAAFVLVTADAHARPLSGLSAGSRGMRTYSAPPSTAALNAAPIRRSMTQPSNAAPIGQTTPSSGLFGGRSLFGGIAAGFIGAGLFGLLFGHGFFGGLRVGPRSVITSRAGGHNSPADHYLVAGAPYVSGFLRICEYCDGLQFRRSRWDVEWQQCRLINRVTDVKLLQGDLAEAWREGGTDYATLAMKYALKDSMVERTSGRIVEGGRGSDVTELWTFMRARGGNWLLSAIQQT
jgi:predicted lipid-binding transport protein (Tim44 family)